MIQAPLCQWKLPRSAETRKQVAQKKCATDFHAEYRPRIAGK
jgi:hypothetical protein